MSIEENTLNIFEPMYCWSICGSKPSLRIYEPSTIGMVSLPFVHALPWTFHDFCAMMQARVLIIRSWTRKKVSSPHDPSGSWFRAIQSMHEGNCGVSSPFKLFTSATHAVSYAEMLISPSPIDRRVAWMASIISGKPLCSSFKKIPCMLSSGTQSVYICPDDAYMWFHVITYKYFDK